MIRLAIADDHPVVREGLKHLVSDSPNMQIVCEAANGREVIPMLRENQVDILLLDISMPGGKFLDTLQRIHTEKPGVKVLVLSVHPEESYALRAHKAGARGYLTKDHTPEELVAAIHRIHHGGKYISASLAEQLLYENIEVTGETLHERLSNREYEILCMLGSGKRPKDIADDLSISPKTVSAHRKHILEKLKLRSTSELIRYAMEHGLDS